MQNNKANQEILGKVLTHLSHPITLISVCVLLLNDWFLRIYWPSWLTGKLGDFAWMFFFPFVAAAIILIIIPQKFIVQERSVKVSAFLLACLIFSLPKLIPAVNGGLNNLLGGILGVPTNIRRDPTDLMALLSVGLAWRFWDLKINWKKTTLIPGWITLQVALLLTIANAPAQDFGIDALEIEKDQIVAHSAYFKFISEDGGLTWEQDEFSYSEDSQNELEAAGPIIFDYIPGEVIRISRDGGESFPHEYSLIPANQPLQLKYEQRNGSPVFEQGPLDAVIDPVTGNIIFAMGHEGILVFRSNNTWEWVSVDKYQRLQYDPKNELASLILGEIFLAIGFGFLIINTFTIIIHKGFGRKLILVLGWGVFILNVLILPPGILTNNQLHPYQAILPFIFFIVQLFALILFFILGVLDLIKVFPHSKKAATRIILISLFEISIFITPYVLWGLNILPKYRTASILAASIGAIVLIGLYMVMFKSIDSLSSEIQKS